MKHAVIVVGSIMFSLIAIAIPMLFAFSLAYKWGGFFNWILLTLTACEEVAVYFTIAANSMGDDT